MTQRVNPAKITQAERRRQALELRKAGATYEQIAAELGIKSKRAAWGIVQTALAEITHEPAQQVLDLELARLDAMLVGLWSTARKGNHGSVDRVLRIMDRRARYLGLDAQPEQTTVDASALAQFLTGLASAAPPDDPLITAATT